MNKNKTIFDKGVLLLAGLGAAAALLCSEAPRALASGLPSNLNITNCLAGTNVITSYPTNSAGTNGIPQQTGRAVYLGNVRSFEFGVQGFLVNTGAATTVSMTLIPAYSGSQPQVTMGTNLLSVNVVTILQNDFLDPAQAYTVVIPIPATSTNWYNWSTNMDVAASRFGNANWVGVYSISNNIPTSGQWTNVAAYVNTKLIPTPLIGQ